MNNSINLGPISLTEFGKAMKFPNSAEKITEIFRRRNKTLSDKELKKAIEECKQIGQFCLKAMKCKASKPKLSGWYYSYGDQIFNEQFDLLKLGRNNEIVNIEIKREMPPKKEKINDQCNRHYMFLKTAFLRYIEKQGIEISKIKLNLLCYEVILENEAFICYQAIDGKRTPMVKNFKEVISSLPNNSGNKKNILFKIFSRENLLISFTQNWEDAKKGLYVLSHQQKDDETKIENLIRDSKSGLYAIEGNAGTGKSLLLFDLAKHISQNGVKVALFCKNGDNLPKFNPYLSTFSFSGLELLNYYEEAVNTKKVITMRDIGDTRRPRNTGRLEDFLYLLPPYVRPEKWPYYLSASPRVQKDMLENVIRPATNTSLIQLCRSYIEDKYTPNERFLDQELLDYRFAEYIHILLRNYAVILIDEAQCLPLKICKDFIQLKNREKAIVFCYDKDQTITLDEKDSKISKLLRGEICKHHRVILDNEIRQKEDIYAFCEKVASGKIIDICKYKNVKIVVTNNPQEKEEAIKKYTGRGYVYICYPSFMRAAAGERDQYSFRWEDKSGYAMNISRTNQITTEEALGNDYDKVLLDADWILSNREDSSLDKRGCLYINMTRAKLSLCLLTSNVKQLNKTLQLFPPVEE